MKKKSLMTAFVASVLFLYCWGGTKGTLKMKLMILSLVIFLSPSIGNAASFATATLDSGSVGRHTSIAVDSSDTVHISYFDNTNDNLKYITNVSGSFVASTVDGSSADVGRGTSIAIDSADNVHISYRDSDNGNLKYATNASGSWITQTLDSSGNVGIYSSIDIDSGDRIHISYHDETNRDLKYITNASGSFLATTLDTIGDVGEDTSIAVDSLDKVHISYRDTGNGDLKYATNASGSFVTATLDNSGNVDEGTSIAVDSSNKVHISYFDAALDAMKYLTNVTGSFVDTTVDSVSEPFQLSGSDTSITIDSSDKVHIAYFLEEGLGFSFTGYLKYATNASGFFVANTVDNSSQIIGEYPSIAIDSSGKVHISYYDIGDLKYAFSVITLPSGQQSFSYGPVVLPVKNINPAKAKPISVGPVAEGGNTLEVRVALEQFVAPVDIFGAYIKLTDPNTVYVLNPDGISFAVFNIEEILFALFTGIPPTGTNPWKVITTGPVNQTLFSLPVSPIPSGTYTAYFLAARLGGGQILANPPSDLNNYYLWITSFVIP